MHELEGVTAALLGEVLSILNAPNGVGGFGTLAVGGVASGGGFGIGAFEEAPVLLELRRELAELLAGGGQLRAAGFKTRSEVGDAVCVCGGAGRHAFEIDGGLAGGRVNLAKEAVESIAALDATGVLGVEGIEAGSALVDGGGVGSNREFGGGEIGVQLHEATAERDTELTAKLVSELAEALCLRGLPFEGAHLAGDLVEDIVDTREVLLCRFKAKLGKAFLGLEAGDAGRLFDDRAPIVRFGAEKLTNAFLADDGVTVAAQTGTQKDVLDVAQTADLAIEQILGVAGAEEASGYGDLPGTHGSAVEFTTADLENDVFCGASRRGWCHVRLIRGIFVIEDDARLSLKDGFFGFGRSLLADFRLIPIALWDGDVRGMPVGEDEFGAVLMKGHSVVDVGIDESE